MLLSPPDWKNVLTRLREKAAIDDARWRRADALLTGPREFEDMVRALGVDRHLLLQSVADMENMPFLNLEDVTPAPEALQAMPEALARRHGCLGLFLNDRELTVAVGASDWARLDALSQALAPYQAVFVLADAAELARLIELSYTSALEAELAAYLQAEGARAHPRGLADRPPIIRIVEAILSRAARQGASDIHLEPRADASLVRLRVDGLLTVAFRFDATLHEAMISRLKVMSELNIAERQRPQDGRFSFEARGRTVEARLSTLRTAHGEKAVIRLLGQLGGAPATLGALGMAPDVAAGMVALLAQPYGLILVTGPTGSGKTSTLYAALRQLAAGPRNVVSLEDPVEIQLPGINQVPMRPELDLNFATGLRAVLRQDPDVVMVGEIRDQETAEIALRGALTGHLLLSTLHANDSAETITRLFDMGVEAAHVGPALLGVLAQRMVRRLCPCHGYRSATAEERRAMGLDTLPGAVPVPTPRGCLSCAQTGFRGRLALFELLVVDASVRTLVQQRASADAIRAAAERSGMRDLWAAGIREVLAGQTTLEEIQRVVRRAR